MDKDKFNTVTSILQVVLRIHPTMNMNPHFLQEHLKKRMMQRMMPLQKKSYIFISRHVSIHSNNVRDKCDENTATALEM